MLSQMWTTCKYLYRVQVQVPCEVVDQMNELFLAFHCFNSNVGTQIAYHTRNNVLPTHLIYFLFADQISAQVHFETPCHHRYSHRYYSLCQYTKGWYIHTYIHFCLYRSTDCILTTEDGNFFCCSPKQ